MDTPRSLIVSRIGAAIAAAALGACAATPPPAAPVPVVPVAATAAPVNHANSSLGKYKRVVRNGETFYCVKETPTGTRMVQETCLTQVQMTAIEEEARNFTQDAQTMTRLPPSSPNVH